MSGSGFDMRLAVETALRRALPYGGLPGNDSPQMAFFDAATEGDLRRLRVRELASGKDAEEKASLTDVSIQGLGPFQAAARLGKVDVCRCMVEELGFDIDAGSEHGVTALAAAVQDGQTAVVRYLLDHGADPNKKDNGGWVPLHHAAHNGHDEAARLLLSGGASVDIVNVHGTPLHYTASHGKPGVMKVLLEHHADPNKVSEVVGTPLVAALNATSEGLPESIALKCVKLLVAAGADLNSTNADTPLVVATYCGLTDCIEYFLKAGSDPNIARIYSNEGSEVLGAPLVAALNATSQGLSESVILKCVKLLVEAGADVNSTNPDTDTPLVVATTYGLTDCIEYLLKAGSDPNISSSYCDDTPIQIAACFGRRKHVELLFPVTYPIQTISNWTVEGIMGHTQSKYSEDEHDDTNTKDQLKLSGKEAVERKDYRCAAMFYTKAIELDRSNAKLYSNRSFCHLQLKDAAGALFDANNCIILSPAWIKGYYRKGVALMFLKKYKEACDVFKAGLKLKPADGDMKEALRDALEAMKRTARFGKG